MIVTDAVLRSAGRATDDRSRNRRRNGQRGRSRGGAESSLLANGVWRDRGVIGRRITIRDLELPHRRRHARRIHGHSATDVDLWMPFAAAMHDQPGWDRDAHRNILSIVVRRWPRPDAVGRGGAGSRGDRTPRVDVADRRRRGRGDRSARRVVAERRRPCSCSSSASRMPARCWCARAMRRRHDVAIRAALGASRVASDRPGRDRRDRRSRRGDRAVARACAVARRAAAPSALSRGRRRLRACARRRS